MSKEFVWELEIDNDYKIFKCVVGEDEVITYEGDVEKKHLKITNPTKKIGVLQIDTETRVYGYMIPFRMENDTPYLLVEGSWIMSETTREERLEKTVKIHRRNAALAVCAGAIVVASAAVAWMLKVDSSTVMMMFAIGLMMVYAGISTTIRLKQELKALVEAEKAAAEEKAAKKAAWAAERAALEAGVEVPEAAE